MISYQDAKKIVQDMGQKHALKTETLALADSIGRVCVEEILAPINIQPFDNSAMDGFAVYFSDLENATEETPVKLEISAMIAAGDAQPSEALAQGTCIEIMTGAPMPPQADAVIPIELTSRTEDDKISFSATPKQNANIRRAGEDFTKGQKVLSKGTRIKPQHIMILATLGASHLTVFKTPKAVFLSTGNELIDDLTQDLKSGQIYNSNHPYGVATLKDMGIDCQETPSLPDDVDSFVTLLKSCMEQNIDLIISSGAVSMGKFDFVRKGLEDIGAEILFHKVKMKPGKPNLFARLPNGSLYFGLPGNPVATACGLRFFVRPCFDAMLQQKPELPIFAKAENNFRKRAGLQMFLKGQLNVNTSGELSAQIMDGQQSFMVSPFADMNVWVAAPTDSSEINAGDMVELHPFYRNIQL